MQTWPCTLAPPVQQGAVAVAVAVAAVPTPAWAGQEVDELRWLMQELALAGMLGTGLVCLVKVERLALV
jgi:hypothetical protein